MADGAPLYGPEARVLDQLRHEQDVVGAARMFAKTGSWAKVFWAMILCDLTAAFLALLWLKPLAARTIAQAQLSLQQMPVKGSAAGGGAG